MRKLWPPTYDDFSARLWAAIVSVCLNAVAAVLLHSHPELLVFFWPGVIAFALVGRQGFEEADFSWMSWLGLIAGAVVNVVFYYLVAWLLIRSFRPATDWWPERRT